MYLPCINNKGDNDDDDDDDDDDEGCKGGREREGGGGICRDSVLRHLFYAINTSHIL